MESVQLYLNQQFPDAWYSEILYTRNTGATAGQNYNQLGAKYVFVHGIIVTSADLGVIATFTDQFGRFIFATHANGNNSGPYPVYFLIEGDSFRITTDVVNANFVFTVQHQYMRITDIKNPNRLEKQ